MLTSILTDGTKVLAQEVDREERPFYCPECSSETILHKGMIKIPHFAHKPPVFCQYGTGESEAHRECKQAIYDSLIRRQEQNLIKNCEMEKKMPGARPDIYFEIGDQKIAIEVQISSLTMEKIIARTQQYTFMGVAVLWISIFRDELYEKQYGGSFTPKQWEKWLHATYYGRVYYWLDGLDLVPIHYDYYSKRYKTPVHGEVLDLLNDFKVATRIAWKGGNIFVPCCTLFLDTQKAWWQKERKKQEVHEDDENGVNLLKFLKPDVTEAECEIMRTSFNKSRDVIEKAYR